MNYFFDNGKIEVATDGITVGYLSDATTLTDNLINVHLSDLKQTFDKLGENVFFKFSYWYPPLSKSQLKEVIEFMDMYIETLPNVIYRRGKYDVFIFDKHCELFISEKYIHSIDSLLSEVEAEEHIKLAAETFDFNYHE